MTTTQSMPRPWATNTNYSSGPDAGTPTKVDPASDANGFIAGVIAAPQHVNYHLAQQSLAVRQAMYRACILRFSGIKTDDASIPTALAACSQGVVLGKGLPTVVGCVNTNGTPLVHDGGVPVEAGAVASVTASIMGAACNPALPRIVLVGSGGNGNCYSDNGGTSWSAGAALGGAGRAVIWNPTYSRFMALYADHARYATDPSAAWTDVALSGAGSSSVYGMARLTNGNVVTPTNTTGPALKISTNGGTSWAATSGVPTFTGGAGSISVAGQGFATIFCARAATVNAHTGVVVASSTDGNTWTTVASLDYFALFADNVTNAAIKQCPDTGILFLAAATNQCLTFSASLDGGVSWSPPARAADPTIGDTNWSVAGGRIIAIDREGNLLLSDGFGIDQAYAA